MSVPRMRTVTQAIALIKEQDSGTAVTMNCIRSLCKRGIVRHTTVGKKLLVDYDDLLANLSFSFDNSQLSA